jgi:putative PEP-CTERM system TPR-repeat lipoprotein
MNFAKNGSRFQFTLLAMAVALAVTACGQKSGGNDLIKQAEADVAKGDFASAEIRLKNALQANPDDPASRLSLGKINLSMARFAGAESESRRALELGSDPKAVYPLLLEALAMQGEHAKLVEDANKMRALPGLESRAQATALVYAGRGQFGLKDSSAANASFDQALKLDADSVDAKVGHLVVQIATGKDLNAAKAATETLRAGAPNNAQVQALAGTLFRMEGKLPEALLAVQKAVELKPYDLEQRAGLTKTLIDLREYAQADLQVQTLNRLASGRPLVAYLAGLSAFQQGHLQTAREYLQRFVDLAPDFAPGLELAGEVAFQSGELGLAEKYAKALITSQPKLLSGPRLLASVYLASNSPEKALTVLAPLVQAKTNAPEILVLTGEALIKTGDTVKGIQFLDAAVSASGDSTRLKVVAATARLGTGADAMGLQMLEAAALPNQSPQADLAIARSLANAKQYDKALVLAQRFSQAQPKDAAGPYTEGMIAAARGPSDDAYKAFARALVLNPFYLPAADALAQLDLGKNKLDDAKGRYAAILKANPKHVGAYLSLARLSALAGGAEAEALGYFKQAREADPSSTFPVMELARYYFSTSQAMSAVTLLEPVVQSNPKDAALIETLATAYEKTGAYAKAITLLEREIQANTLSGALNYRVGVLRMRLPDFNGALASFKRAEELQPNAIEPKVAIASTLFTAGKRAEAYVMAKALQASTPTSAVGPSLQGDFFDADNKPDEALAQYRRAFEISKNSTTANKLYGALQKAKRSDEAKSHLALWWSASQPKDVATMLAASDLLLDRKEWKETVAVLNEVLKVNPKSPAALNNAAIAVHHLKEPKALQLAQRAYQIEPQNYAIMDTYGWILVEQNQVDEGLKLLKVAALKAPRSPGVRLHLAQAFAKSGDLKSAQAEAQNALKNNPDPDQKLQAERLAN